MADVEGRATGPAGEGVSGVADGGGVVKATLPGSPVDEGGDGESPGVVTVAGGGTTGGGVTTGGTEGGAGGATLARWIASAGAGPESKGGALSFPEMKVMAT